MEYLTIAQASNKLPGNPHRNTIQRWMTKGISGIKLRSTRVGGKRFTTPAWCDEFIAAQSGVPTRDTAAHAELDQLGVS